jgi:tetratricopeptide (TPR) repeat protein
MALWNNEARNLVMNAVLAEDTDTPYHRAIRDFASARYAEALDKYRAIVDANPRDRIGLLGIAMSYERLGRANEADESYGHYLAVEPGNQSVLAHVIKAARSDTDQGRARLEGLISAGVRNAELLATVSEIAAAAGDNESALRFATDATDAAPGVTMYHLNAGVLADRLNKPAVAVRYYEQFLALLGNQAALVDTSIDGVKQRLRFLRARL